MAGEFSVAYESGLSLYALVFQPVFRTAWDGSDFIDPTGSAWPSCAVALVDDGAGTYSGEIPAAVPLGNYLVQAYLQLGSGPADSDPIVGTGSVFWPGSGDPPPGSGFRAGLTARLNGDPVLASLVGDRIYPQVRPQDSPLPAVVFRVPSIDRSHDLDGPAGWADGLLELTAHALDFTECDQVAQVLRNLFDGFTGAMGDVEVVETVSEDEADEYDDAVDGSDDGTHQITVAYQLSFHESTPNRSTS